MPATDYLDQLAAAGLGPEDIDVVVTTHLHVDHVGWNTVRHDGAWVPTFPDATYLLPEQDLAHCAAPGTDPARRLHVDDSVVPVQQARQAVTSTDAYRIDEHLTLESAPGHTPGTSVVKVHSGGEQAAFVGDILHNPVQIVDPDSKSCFCLDPIAARSSRLRLLGWAADHHALVIPAHFGGAGAADVARKGDTFHVKGWAPST